MYILGISAFYHDSAACLVKDGEIFAAAQEERFSRKKHDPRFPKKSIKYCLEEAGIKVNQLNHVVFYDKPFQTFQLKSEFLTSRRIRSSAQYGPTTPIPQRLRS